MLLMFEDDLWRNFVPLSYTRPLFDMRCGAFTLRERIAAMLETRLYEPVRNVQVDNRGLSDPDWTRPVGSMANPAPTQQFAGLCRSQLMACYGPRGGIGFFLRESTPVTLINGRTLDLSWLPRLLAEPVGVVYESGGTLLGARLSPALASVALYYLRDQRTEDALEELRRFGKVVEIETTLCNYPWDFITQAGEQLIRDLPLLAARLPRYQTADPQVVVHGAEHIYVAPTAQLDGPLVLDARDGPIFIDEYAHIEPFSFIQGPTYIGKKTLISSARIRAESSIGPVCRIGGEVEASTIQAYSNKHHDGFLGHSWLGEWVNIGAMTTNSDLKNNYGTVRVAVEHLGNIDTGQLKLGCFLADHVKLGIGMHLSGGSVVGTGSSIYGIHMVPKTVPPFTWGSEVFYEYHIDRMVTVSQKVMGRRKQELTPEYETMLRTIFTMTRPHRGRMKIVPSRLPTPETGDTKLELLTPAETEAIRAYEPLMH